MRRVALLALALLAGPASVQSDDPTTEPTNLGDGAVVRGLDKLSGETTDFELDVGETVGFGRVQISLGECRYPRENPSGNAYAWLIIRDAGEQEPVFDGWMIAASPALNALDHPRYDVWVMRCTTS